MQVFRCPACATPLYFHNLTCTCGEEVVFDPAAQSMTLDGPRCRNRGRINCNWRAEGEGFCRSCAMTEMVPDLSEPENLALWSKTELAKRWMLANLGRWGWFTPKDAGARPVFRMLSEQTSGGDARVTMGHANGVITINVSEARDSVRVERQAQMGELYRTMIGHMRHEMAHFIQLRLAADETFLTEFRDLFGDERDDYGEALKRHYASPRQPEGEHITSYATAHPHEDWAETIAHLLHLVDLLDSAAGAGLTLAGGPAKDYDAYAETDTDLLLTTSIRLSIAMNHVNRAMDLPDLYPFVLTRGVRRKLGFAHAHMRRSAAA